MTTPAASGVLETLAPLVMGAVGQTQQQNNLDACDLSNVLNSEQQQGHEMRRGLWGMLGSILDQIKMVVRWMICNALLPKFSSEATSR